MRTDNRSKKRRIKLDSRFWARVLVVLLSLSMLAGTFYYVLLFFSMKTVAADGDDSSWNIFMRIGLAYDDKTTCSVRVTAEQGFDVGYNVIGTRTPTSIGFIEQTDVYVSRHVNLKLGSSRYEKASSAAETTVGSYHIDVLSDENYKDDITLIRALLPEYHAFPAYMHAERHVLVGQFATEEEANTALAAIKNAANSEAAASLPSDLKEAMLASSVRAPKNNDTVIIDSNTHKIVWLHASSDTNVLLTVSAHQNDVNTKVYMYCRHKTSSSETNRKYDGYLEFSHNSPSEYFGVEVVNLVRLENYIVGVCSAEIPTTWPIETIKAFSVAVRSFAVSRLNGHRGFSADLCNEDCCQVFNGYGPAVDRVWRAVGETSGIIATSNGNLCGTYYSSSTGGCTANVTDVWGSSLSTYPYLKAVATPWEKYTTYSRGQKTSTVTGTELYELLENKDHTELEGPVTNVQITKTGNNTSYVTEIKFYDAKGNCVTVTRADRIKKLLGSYVYSANFVVAKSGDTVTRPKYTLLGFGATNPTPPEGLYVLGNPFLNKVTGRQQFSVITADGIKTFYDGQEEKVMTGSGIKDLNMSLALDSQVYPAVIGINGEVLPDITKLSPIVESETLTTAYAADSFTFISRGWGHGVGMSQYGIYELGNLGYDFRYILKAYYSGISYVTYKEYLGK